MAERHSSGKGKVGRYRLGRVVGEGGMGVVWEAMDEVLERRVAVKVLRQELAENPGFLERFRREAKAVAKLSHANIIQIFDIGQEEDWHYFAMEFVEGTSLERLVSQKRLLTDAEAVGLLLQATSGLSHAWGKKIIHRDLKPANLLLSVDGTLKIADFGLAKALAGPVGLTEPGHGMGTPYYVSREQAMNAKDVDLRSDVYSLGATFYHLLTGRVPFEGESPMEVAIKVATIEFPPVCSVKPEVHPSLAAIIERMLCRDPARRFQDAKELNTALRALNMSPAPAPAVAGDVQADSPKPTPVPSAPSAPSPAVAPAQAPVISAPPPAQQQQPAPAAPPVAAPPAAAPPRATPDPGVKIDLPPVGPFDASPKSRSGEIITNSVGIRLAWIGPGSFIMGSPESEAGRHEGEKEHPVTITRGFFIGAVPITQKQWRDVMGSSPSFFKADELPVERISMYDVNAFLRSLSQAEGRRYRLPTEAEWEYACRAGTTGSFGGTGDADGMAWHGGNSDMCTKPVGQKWPNGWGLHDMHGNIWEWCRDYYVESYPVEPQTDPTGPANGVTHVLRGGAWDCSARRCRSASRAVGSSEARLNTLGFRVVLEADAVAPGTPGPSGTGGRNSNSASDLRML